MANIEFGTWTPEPKSNPYAEIASAFVKAYADNPNVAYTLTVDAEKASNERNKFAKAVNAENMTARLRSTETVKVKGEADKARMVFTLTKRHKARNRKEK